MEDSSVTTDLGMYSQYISTKAQNEFNAFKIKQALRTNDSGTIDMHLKIIQNLPHTIQINFLWFIDLIEKNKI
jgi:hypothetical protein